MNQWGSFIEHLEQAFQTKCNISEKRNFKLLTKCGLLKREEKGCNRGGAKKQEFDDSQSQFAKRTIMIQKIVGFDARIAKFSTIHKEIVDQNKNKEANIIQSKIKAQ